MLYNESQSLPMSAKNDYYKTSQEDGIYQSLDHLTSENDSSESKLTEENPQEIPHQDDKNHEPLLLKHKSIR